MADRMSRETLLPMIAAYALDHGLDGLSLRPLAKAVGTSDRMLLYHFGTKDGMVAALLEHLAQIYSATLDAAFPTERAPSRAALAQTILAVTSQPAFAPFIRIWWEIVAGAARGDTAFRSSAGRMADGLLLWIESHLPVSDPDPATGAKTVLVMVEGAMMLQALGRGDISDTAVSSLED